MTCEAARRQFDLYLYGELQFGEEEVVERHVEECASCREELSRCRSLHHAMDALESVPPAGLLQASRREFWSRVSRERVAPVGIVARIWSWVSRVTASPAFMRPVGAVALLAVGFMGARAWDSAKSKSEQPVLHVRSVVPDASGGFRLVLDEVRQRTVTGRLDDARIQGMILSAAAGSTDPMLRASSMDALKDHCERADVRKVLLTAMRQDPNFSVRLKAIEGLKPFARDPETRRALSEAVLSDDHPSVRTMAIDLLAGDRENAVIGVLQELMLRESNPDIRQKSLKALRASNASPSTF
ncbi:MAG: HEAT repeat domain-containing protein [Candidatus Solibacter usitatus]|nr:HEAT repeat domain-containing protein [Candidatus Solibacter usitatus]